VSGLGVWGEGGGPPGGHMQADHRQRTQHSTAPVALPRACRLRANPLDQIAERIRTGPLLLLRRCYQERARVRVVTRHARGVRGRSEGAGGDALPACCRAQRLEHARPRRYRRHQRGARLMPHGRPLVRHARGV
jgi:hypothetical protein